MLMLTSLADLRILIRFKKDLEVKIQMNGLKSSKQKKVLRNNYKLNFRFS